MAPHLCLAAAAAIGLGPPLASAANDTLVAVHDDAAPLKQLGVVEIRGARPSSLPSQIPTTTESITGEQVEATVNATDSEDALKYLPSLLVRKRYIGDYNHAVLSTRASGTGNSARSLVYADGVLLSNLLGNGASFTPRWGLVTPEEIARVDVLYGPFSAAYPGNSVGAVVDYVTRMPSRFEAHAKVAAFVQPFELYGTRATYRGWQASASLGDKRSPWSWWINLNRLDSEGQPLVFATRSTPSAAGVSGAVPVQEPSGRDAFVIGASSQNRTVQDHGKAKLVHALTPSLQAAWTAGWWHNRARGNAATYLRDAAGAAVYTGVTLPLNHDAVDHTMHALSLKQHSGGRFDWDLALSRYDYVGDRVATSTTALPDAAEGRAGRLTDLAGTGWNTWALKGIWRPAPAHAVDIGLQQDQFRLRSTVSTTADWTGGVPDGTAPSRFDGQTRLRSVFVQDSWRLAEAWRSVLGLRAEQWSAWGGLTSSACCRLDHPARSAEYLSPKAAIAFQAAADWVLKASTGRAVRFPTVSELYQGGFNTAGEPINQNPGLRPERSWTTELSAERSLSAAQWRVTLFHEATRDALFAQLNPATGVNTVQNVDRVRTLGLESAWQADNVGLRGLDLAGSVTYADSKIVANAGHVATPGDTVGKRQPRVPQWRATLLVTWRAGERWSVSYGARYSGRQYNTLNNSDPHGFTYRGTSKFFTTDLRLRVRIDRHWSAAVGIDNLNDYPYWNFHPYPQRTGIAELKFDL